MKKIYLPALALAMSTGALGTANATEFGESHVDLGYTDTFVAVPGSPGFYIRTDEDISTSGTLNGGNGRTANLQIPPYGVNSPIRLRATSEETTFSLTYVPSVTLPFNISIASQIYGAFVNARLAVETPGLPAVFAPEVHPSEKAGLSDITVVPVAFLYNIPADGLYFALAPFDFTAPTGRYDKLDDTGNNVGKNYWSYRPAVGFTIIAPTRTEADLALGLSFNTTNNATHYHSGDEFSATYSVQQYITQKVGLGIGGYFYDQFTNDTINGQVVYSTPAASPIADVSQSQSAGNRGRTMAIGPVLSYNYSPNLLFEAHWDHELYAVNRAREDQIVFRVVGHFD